MIWVINATSAGLSNDMPPLPEGIFAPDALAYDMVYGRETPFMAFARRQGARAVDGLGMLVEQAAESFLHLARREAADRAGDRAIARRFLSGAFPCSG